MFSTDHEFEDEVRRIARLLWPQAEFDGAAIEDGRERDGVFETDEFVNLIECTTSRSKDKASEDGQKLAKLARNFIAKHPDKFVKGWFITLSEPTADQRSEIKSRVARDKVQIVAVSFDQFRSRLVDARSYLSHRESYPFGSVRDPESGNTNYTFEYIPLPLLDASGVAYDGDTLSDLMPQAPRVVLLGDYGAGKSATLRQVFIRLAERFCRNQVPTFPILLNLRDHHGQVDPVEALERHARRIGFTTPSALVRAWRAGLVTLLLDGFDEIAAAGWAGKTKTLKELRYRSMELIRTFLKETPPSVGVALAGRAHFFDNSSEMKTSLGIRSDTLTLELSD